jgi:hypothetical protein
MEEIRIRIGEIKRLAMLLLIQKERLEGIEEEDPSKGSIHKTLVAIKQLNKKIETILGNKKLRTPEELEMEICKSE